MTSLDHYVPLSGDGYRTPTGEEIMANLRERLEPNTMAFPRPDSYPRYNPTNLRPNPSESSLPGRPGSAVSTIDGSTVRDKEDREENDETWRMRIRHFTWAFFTINMATGGIASVIDAIPFRFHGLYAIGYIFFVLNVLLFIANVSAISLRFGLYPKTFRASLTHPSESLFAPASIVGFGILLTNLSQYGMPSTNILQGLFWWSTQTFTISTMLPTWGLPIYPLLIVGPHAGILSRTAPPSAALSIIVGGSTLQGIGFIVSLMIYSAFIYRLMTQKLPQQALRPSMFVSVGPSAFTATALIIIGQNLERATSDDFMGGGKMAAFVLRIMANWVGIILWGVALWFFFVSVSAHYSCITKKDWGLNFTLSWFSFVFPNTALVLATLAVGSAFGSRSIQVLGTVMSVILIIVWAAVVGMMIRAIKLRQILWPEMGEDRVEGGFRQDM
ncbi:MAG: hypothetical protein M1814_000239 [Vezdaea aestivalis]|nr:MAG: hypothetical protein M1814_000239 [Vezdaea aestivalis]